MYRAGWIGLLVQDGLCAGNLDLHFSRPDHSLQQSPSVTLWPSHQADPCKTQHRLLLPDSLTHAPSVFFYRIRGWRVSATSCAMVDGACGCRFESKCECFPVANILSLKTCNSTSSLCCPEPCAFLGATIVSASSVPAPSFPASGAQSCYARSTIRNSRCSPFHMVRRLCRAGYAALQFCRLD